LGWRQPRRWPFFIKYINGTHNMTDKIEKTNTDNGRITVPLETPLKRGDQTIPKVQLRKPSSGELRGLNLHDVLNLDVTAMHKLLPRITAPALTEHDVSQLDPVDLVALGTEMASFFIPKAKQDSLTA
jgi:hypothetical protein